MKKVLLTRRTDETPWERFEKVFCYRVRKDGTFMVASKWNGTVEGYIAKNAVKFLMNEPAAQWIDVPQGRNLFRVTLYEA